MRSTVQMFKSCECDQDDLLDLAEDQIVALRDICAEMREGCNQGCTRVQKTLGSLSNRDDNESETAIDETLTPLHQVSMASISVGGSGIMHNCPSRYPGGAGTYCLRQEQQHHQHSASRYSSPS